MIESKRIFDLCVSILLISFLWPLLLIIALIVKLSSSGPILFIQERMGRHGKPFRIMKFRTMISNADSPGLSLTPFKDPRITTFGRFLRYTKADELPQLFNVLRGEMSLVGPRPELPRFTTHYSSEEKRILSIRPGMTDWASLKYIDEDRLLADAADVEAMYLKTIMPDKLKINLEYLKNRTMLLDLQILLHTGLRLFARNPLPMP
ncbi:MAG: sugar transferase [Elusimicrobiota bacterium]|jgi:lipopolysaccharide/colanic/teichoic acid biosynthesis glycosyltransferase